MIHGAGVIEDRLIADKSPDSLARVLAVKAGAARTLAQRLRPESLRFLVLFSSVSGRFGNRGQADYAAASEALAQLANELDRDWPGRVVAIDWGPWSGTGMVSEALEREFERRGVALIDIEAGSRILADELASGRVGEAELVIGAASGLERGRTPPAEADCRAIRPARAPRGCRCSPAPARASVTRRARSRSSVSSSSITTATSATTGSTASPCSRSRRRWS